MSSKVRAVVGGLFIIALGFVFHFMFEWLGYNRIAAAVFPVNESVWEHMKLILFPALLWSIIEYIIISPELREGFCASRAAGIITAMVSIPLLFYIYTGITGENYIWADILIFIIAVAAGQIIIYKLETKWKNKSKYNFLGCIILAVVFALFVIFTYYPPHCDIFMDSITGGYGIVEK